MARKNGKAGLVAALCLADLCGPLNRPYWSGLVTSFTGALAGELRRAIQLTAEASGLAVHATRTPAAGSRGAGAPRWAAIAPRGGARSAAGPHERPPPPRCPGGRCVGCWGRERAAELFQGARDQAGLLPLVVQRGELAAEHPVLGLQVRRLLRERRGVGLARRFRRRGRRGGGHLDLPAPASLARLELPRPDALPPPRVSTPRPCGHPSTRAVQLGQCWHVPKQRERSPRQYGGDSTGSRPRLAHGHAGARLGSAAHTQGKVAAPRGAVVLA